MKTKATSFLFCLIVFLTGCKRDPIIDTPESTVTRPVTVFGSISIQPSGFGPLTYSIDRFSKNPSGGWTNSQLLPHGSEVNCFGNGILYATSRINPSNSFTPAKNLFAIEVSTGAIKWQILNYDKVFGTLIIRNDTVFAQLFTDTKEYIAAINAGTGAFIWIEELPRKFNIFNLELESQTVFFRYVNWVPSPTGGSVTEAVYGVASFNLTTRALNWYRDMDVQSIDENFSTVFNAPRIYVNSNRTLLCLDKATGQNIWSKPEFNSSIRVESGSLFATFRSASNYILKAMNAETGTEIWTRALVTNYNLPLTLHLAISAYGVIAPIGTSLLCLNKTTGANVWEAPYRFNTSQVEVLKQMIIIRRAGGETLFFINAENGNKTDSLDIQQTPIRRMQEMYVVDDEGNIKEM